MQSYHIAKHEGIENLALTQEATIPQPKRGQVLVRMRAASLNFRDLLVVKGLYPGPFPSQLIPCSDGAGEVVSVGEDVSEFVVGDRVCGLFHQDWIAGDMKDEHMANDLGGSSHGVLSQYRVFEKHGIIKMPSNLTFEEAATLPCAGLTAYHALAQNGIKHVGPSQSVLVIGTGGVSIFAAQFAVAAGAKVIVVSSSDEKLEKAKSLGAQHLINYSKTPNWQEKVREIVPNGVDHVIEVGGAGTLQRSLQSVKRGGQVHMIGLLAQKDPNDNFDVGMSVLFSGAILRGFIVGSRAMFEDMVKTIENNDIHPVVDKVFSFDQAQEAFKHMESQKHVGKVVIRID
ncbi:predicted protein [Naegleria gruberi]|uniref:Predicted protein n=1 Tax=Naegleria gruberi TaxID=5762 RepID=D2VCC7_NAEGR|nr:uncharacterized protein NAEGRDRAFT_56126 [Naegleria gruberi]EFC45729.1 predicted protein [Naegleria gruberi]|eukprot:XP_002678473.1 predicted protein [Naegleria gruberi strain NEG-M]